MIHYNAVKAGLLDYRALPILLYITLSIVLTSCTGGSNGESIGISSEQSGTDPVAIAVPIAYIKRPLPVDTNDLPDLRNPNAFHSGAELYVREQSSSTNEIAVHEQIMAITAAEEGVDIDEIELDIKDLESSYDGKTLIFAARAVPTPVNTNLELTTWNIWQYDIENQQVSYLIDNRLLRNEGFNSGGGQDTAPYFLNDEEIIFSSTRQINSQAKQLNEGRAQLYAALTENRNNPASVLHRFSPEDGANTIKQLSFNPNHDIDPIILNNGQILFSRFNSATNHYSFYTVNPDGLQMSMLYGHRSSNTGSPGTTVNFTQARELSDGRIVAILKTFSSPSLGGNLVIVDKDNYVEMNQPTWDSSTTNNQGQINAIELEVRTDSLRSEGGQFAAVYPLNDDTQRLLVSWSPCRVLNDLTRPIPCNLDPDQIYTILAPPLYGIWMLDTNNNTQQPVVLAEEDFYVSEIVAAQQRDFPSLPPLIDGSNSNIITAEQGQLIIDSVYDIDGLDGSTSGIGNHAEPGTTAFSSRPARFIRLIKPVPLPDDEVTDIPNYAFGVGANAMREILGYSIIEPDGSVNTTVPANTPFTIEIVDANARRISNQHNHWLQLAPGEKLHCVGCHDRNSDQAHGRVDSKPVSSNPGAQTRNDGSIGFFATLGDLFGLNIGDTMATIYDLRRPVNNEDITERQLSLHPVYQDEWTDLDLNTIDPPIDLTYDNQWLTDPNWTHVASPIVVPNLDPNLDSRIVINYVDHIQTIWSRTRSTVIDANGTPVDNCVGCHNSSNDSVVPPGQLDLSDGPSDIDADHFRSYRELLTNDNEQWIDDAGRLRDRERLCNSLDLNGDPILDANDEPIILRENITITRNLMANSATASSAFFNCFNGGTCGTSNNPKPALRPECIEGDGTPEPPTTNTVDHNGLLSEAELRLISEWLDIGAQYYNNPFDSRLTP